MGKIIGMDVEEQYKGSGGAHERAYYFGGGRGERDAANYAAIKTASGGYLGGRANPMSGDMHVAGNAIRNAAPPRRRLAPPPQTDTGQSVMLDNPLGLGNWQMTQRTAFSMHNKTGSDVFIAASTMAG